MAVYELKVNNVVRPLKVGGFNYKSVLNGVDTLTCFSHTGQGDWDPELGQEVTVSEDSVQIFGGTIEVVRERSPGGTEGMHTGVREFEIVCNDFSVYFTLRSVTETYEAGLTLKDILDDLMTKYGGTITLAPGQVDGPTMPYIEFTITELRDAINQLADLTQYTWKVDGDKVFEMWAPGAKSAPWDVVPGVTTTRFDPLSEKTRKQGSFNRVILTVQGAGSPRIDETFIADGSSTADYVMKYPASTYIEDAPWPNELYVNGLEKGPIGWGNDGSSWWWDYPASPAILHHNGTGFVPANGDVVSVAYRARFPFTVIANDLADQALNGVREKRFTVNEAMSWEAAEDYAESLIDTGVALIHKIMYESLTTGLITPGQSQNAEFPLRNFNNAALITEISMTDIEAGTMQRNITIIGGSKFFGSFRDLYKAWLGGGNSVGGGASKVSTVGTGGTIPGGDNYAVQINKHGTLFGYDQLLADYDGGGPHYDSTGDDMPAALASGSTDDTSFMLALWNVVGGKDKAATFHKADNGAFTFHDFPGSAPATTTFSSYRSLRLLGASNVKIQGGTSFGRSSVQVTGVFGTEAFSLGARRITSLPYSIDATDASGSASVYIFEALSGSGTCNLPVLSSQWVTLGGGLLSGSSDFYRIVIIRNDDATDTVTLDPSGSELINGASTLALGPGQAVVLIGWGGTSPGWRTIASSSNSITVPGSDKQVIFNDGGSLGADANFTWDKTKQQLSLLADTTDDDSILRAANVSTNQSVIALTPFNAANSRISFGREMVGNVDTARHARPALLEKDTTDMWMEMGVGETPGSAMAFAKATGMGFSTNTAHGYIYGYGYGTGAIEGPTWEVGRNADGGGAAGTIAIAERNGTLRYLWFEAGSLYKGSARPTEDNTTVSHTSGSIIDTGGGGAPDTLSYLTENDETADLPNSRMVLAGTGISFDDSVAGERTINVSATGAGQLIGVQTFTPSSGTYTPTAGTGSVIIEILGGGGGGSGVAQAAASGVNLGGGGGGGAFLRKRLTANFSGGTYVVGAKGTGGTAGNNSGTNGANSTFTATNAVVYTAGGGGAGDPRTSFTPPISLTGSAFGGEAGLATNGDLNIAGGAAITGFATTVFIGWSSGGGDAGYGYGKGAEPVTSGSGAGTAGANAPGLGGGGSGAYSSNNAGGAKAGGDGGDGIMVIWEYS